MKRIKQFAYGSPFVGNLSRDGVYPRGTPRKSAPDPCRIWTQSQERLAIRGDASGISYAETLRAEACEQAKLGWLAEPLPIDGAGNVATYEKGAANIAFRFGSGPDDKFRACDDMRINTTNFRGAVVAPIKFPTSGHLSKLRLNIRVSDRKWDCFNADHQAAYSTNSRR